MMQGAQLWIVLGIVLLLFGGARLPKLARDLGRSQQEFKAGMEEGKKPADEDSASKQEDGAVSADDSQPDKSKLD